jgi:hypothetical protein
VRRFIAALAGAAALTAGLVALPAPAQAATIESYCYRNYYSGDACFYYRDGRGGSMVGVLDLAVNDVMNPSIAFISPGDGQYKGIGNAAGSEENGDYYYYLRIWEHSGYWGRFDTLNPGTWIGHGGGVTINNERSYQFF